MLGASLFLGAALLFPLGNLWLHAAFAVCLAGTIVAFWRNRRFYLEETLREQKARVQAAPASGL